MRKYNLDLLNLDENIAKTIYLLAFETYEGFSKLNIK